MARTVTLSAVVPDQVPVQPQRLTAEPTEPIDPSTVTERAPVGGTKGELKGDVDLVLATVVGVDPGLPSVVGGGGQGDHGASSVVVVPSLSTHEESTMLGGARQEIPDGFLRALGGVWRPVARAIGVLLEAYVYCFFLEGPRLLALGPLGGQAPVGPRTRDF